MRKLAEDGKPTKFHTRLQTEKSVGPKEYARKESSSLKATLQKRSGRTNIRGNTEREKARKTERTTIAL